MIWNNLSVLLWVLKIENDNRIQFVQANELFYKTFQIDMAQNQKKEVEQIFCCKDAEKLKKICFLCKERNKAIDIVRPLHCGNRIVYWHVVANAYNKNGECFVLFSAGKLNDNSVLKSRQSERKNALSVICESTDHILIQMYRCRYDWFVSDISCIRQSAMKRIHINKMHKNIFDIYPLDHAAFLFYNANDCIKYRKRHHLIKNTVVNGKCIYFDITFIPKTFSSTKSLYVLIKNITDHVAIYESHRDRLRNPEFSIEDMNLGVGIVEFRGNNTCELVKSNRSFLDICMKTGLDGKVLLSHLKDSGGKKKKSVMELPASDGSVYEFDLVPDLLDGNVYRLYITAALAQPPLPSDKALHLTNREVQVLRKIYNGDSNEKIAVELKRSVGTVKKIIYNLYQKLEVHSRGEAVKKAIKYFGHK